MGKLIFSMPQQELPDNKGFLTHLNYVKCMERISNSLELYVKPRKAQKFDTYRINKLENLIRMTKESISVERDIWKEDSSYALAFASWGHVKCYYRLYYLEAVLCHLANGTTNVFGNGSHKNIRKEIIALIQSKTITCSQESIELIKIVSCGEARKFKSEPGIGISQNYYSDDRCIKSLRKKLAIYKIDAGCKKEQRFCLLDYFYDMRIKANYRDVDFLDPEKGVTESQSCEYLMHYEQAYFNYASALEEAISRLKRHRGIK